MNRLVIELTEGVTLAQAARSIVEPLLGSVVWSRIDYGHGSGIMTIEMDADLTDEQQRWLDQHAHIRAWWQTKEASHQQATGN